MPKDYCIDGVWYTYLTALDEASRLAKQRYTTHSPPWSSQEATRLTVVCTRGDGTVAFTVRP